MMSDSIVHKMDLVLNRILKTDEQIIKQNKNSFSKEKKNQ